jgi:uncharacterized protein DUF6580
VLNPRLLAILGMILAAAATRLIPHPPNMTAVGAVALFGGAYFERRWMAFVVPLAAMVASDLVITNPDPVTYLCFALTTAMGLLLRDRVTVGRVTTAAIAASVLFFLVSNFSVWLGSKAYTQDAAGLLECYVLAVPFALNMLVGNLLYCGVLFGGMRACQHVWPDVRKRELAPARVRV